MHEIILNPFEFELEGKITKKPLIKEPKFKNPKYTQFWKSKIWLSVNFIRIPNMIFAKFSVCKKALKTRFFLLFLLEKDLFANFSEKSRGSLQFSLPVVHGVKQSARRRRAVAPACFTRPLTPGSRPDRARLLSEPLPQALCLSRRYMSSRQCNNTHNPSRLQIFLHFSII